MAFIDELRTPLDPHRNDEPVVRGFIHAIEWNCKKAHAAGENRIRGYICQNSESEGNNVDISLDKEPPKYEFCYFHLEGYDWDYIKSRVEQEIKKMGFTSYVFKIFREPAKTVTYEKRFTIGMRKVTKYAGRTGLYAYIELNW